MSLRDRKVARTREAIVAAALELFAEQGYERTSVAQIAERAEIGPRTFFRYFADKQEVLFGGTEDTVELIVATLAPAHPDEPPAHAAVRAARAVLDRLGQLAEVVPVRERIVASTPALLARTLLKYARYAEVVRTELVGRHGLPAERAAVLSAVMLTCARTAYESWCADDPPLGSLPDRFDRVLELAAADLAPFGLSSPAPRTPRCG